MKVFSILKPSVLPNPHPQEDYFSISKKYPIFIVADGVSLNTEGGAEYPKKTGAGEVAKIFCETVMFEAEKRYENFEVKDMEEIFNLGNKAVLDYNISNSRTKDTINYYDVDLFSATASFALIKNNKVYWFSLCDSGVVALRSGEIIFQSPDGWINFPKDWDESKNKKEKIIIRHRDYRNAVKEGKLAGYGVVDGEEAASVYLNSGVLDIKNDDLVFVYTDGFENYIVLDEFNKIFTTWPDDLEKKLEDILEKKGAEDSSKYGREKTIIAISI
jgi:serine/threonine protein phosphatase PrpC